MKKKYMILFIAFMVTLLALAACGANGEDDATGSDAPASNGAGSGQVVEVHLSATNFEFDQEVYEVPFGSTVVMTLSNEEGNHGAMVEGYNERVNAGDTVEFVVDKAGDFTIACSIMCGAAADHNNMLSVLRVVE